MRMWLAMLVVASGACLALAQSANAGERYYVIFFGSESCPKKLKYTHTWGTYIMVNGEGPDRANYQITRVNTISFLPATLDIHVFARRPETAVNLDLYTTLNYVLSNGESVDCWTPMEASPPVYARAMQQWERVMRGEALYRAIDVSGDEVFDCIHANTEIDPKFGRSHYPLTRVGKPATAHIVEEFGKRGLLVDPRQDNTWMLTRLGIDRYPIRIIKPPVVDAHGPCAR